MVNKKKGGQPNRAVVVVGLPLLFLGMKVWRPYGMQTVDH